MSEEEKKVIELLNHITDIKRFDGVYSTIDIIFESIKTVLNLVENQQKEIEKLKYKIKRNYEHQEEMYIPKQKIKNKIDELQQLQSTLFYSGDISLQYEIAIGNLESLLR